VETPDPANPGKRWPAGFKSNLEYLDYLMGKLLAALKADDLDENTLVIFIGDNGTGGDGKGAVTELGARVPCIIRGPGVKRGVVSRAVADLTDIMPTLADYSGAELPKDQPFDGHSLAPVLRGEKEKHRDWIYSHLDDGRVLRDSRWLLEIAKGGKGEKFFDCGESRDGTGYRDVTASTDPEVKAAWVRFTEILAGMPEPKPRAGMTPMTANQKKQKKMQKKGTAPAKPAKSVTANAEQTRAAGFDKKDKNHDGKLSLEEFLAAQSNKDVEDSKTRFEKYDTNHDGTLSREEFIRKATGPK
jgi:hypothetical protein